MGVGLVRSLQHPGILWIHWRVYNSIANTSKGVLFLPPSDVYVRSFLYLLYTLIKLYYTKALDNQASSLAPDWILLLRRPIILAYMCDSATTFQLHFPGKLSIFFRYWNQFQNWAKWSHSFNFLYSFGPLPFLFLIFLCWIFYLPWKVAFPVIHIFFLKIIFKFIYWCYGFSLF